MIHTEQIEIDQLAVHHVGNKSNEEEVKMSEAPLEVGDDVKNLLLTYFLGPFKSQEYYHLAHHDNVAMNEVYQYVANIFDDPNSLFEESKHLAKHLYENSMHPAIKGGEFYTVYFKDLIVDGEMVDCIGLFKSERKENFIKIYPKSGGFAMESESGLNINKLDKGCLIMNTERDKGFLVSIVDTLKKHNEAVFWRDDFLSVQQRKDAYYKTETMMDMCKEFVAERLPESMAISKTEQADMLNKTSSYFKENEAFSLDEFKETITETPEIKDKFDQFKSQYEEEMELKIDDEFEISDNAAKKQSKLFKSVLKLDKNFSIYIHGDKKLVQRGYDDEKNLNYYTFYFDQEK